MNMQTCGFIIEDPRNNKILICHPTNSPFEENYVLPTGHMEKDEVAIETAIRELEEETGIILTKEDIKNINFVKIFHTETPDFERIVFSIKKEVDLTTLKCESVFNHHETGNSTPENDHFRLIGYDELYYLKPELREIFTYYIF